jgi:hypothetical protein
MLTGKLNLAKLEHVIREFPSAAGGKMECIVIPIEKNSLFKTEKGNVFLDIAVFETVLEKRKGDDTHMVSQSFPKEKREAMKASGVYAPILGNLRDWSQEGGASTEANVSQDFAQVQPGEVLLF